MRGITRVPVARVAVDLSKQSYQVHAVDAAGRVVVARAMSAQRFLSDALNCLRGARWRCKSAAAPTVWAADWTAWALIPGQQSTQRLLRMT